MMDDYISRQAAIDAMRRLEQEDIDAYGVKIPEGFDAEPAVKALKALPSAHPEMDEWCFECKEYNHERHSCERYNRVIRDALAQIGQQRVGRWIHMLRDSENDEYRCSVCFNPVGYDYDYCPNCGAYMRGGRA